MTPCALVYGYQRFDPEGGGIRVPPKGRYPLTGVGDVICHSLFELYSACGCVRNSYQKQNSSIGY